MKDAPTSKKLRRKLGNEDINEAMRADRLRWFGHVERKYEEDWIKRVKHFLWKLNCQCVEKKRGKKTRDWVLKMNLESKEFDGQIVNNRTDCQAAIR